MSVYFYISINKVRGLPNFTDYPMLENYAHVLVVIGNAAKLDDIHCESPEEVQKGATDCGTDFGGFYVPLNENMFRSCTTRLCPIKEGFVSDQEGSYFCEDPEVQTAAQNQGVLSKLKSIRPFQCILDSKDVNGGMYIHRLNRQFKNDSQWKFVIGAPDRFTRSSVVDLHRPWVRQLKEPKDDGGEGEDSESEDERGGIREPDSNALSKPEDCMTSLKWEKNPNMSRAWNPIAENQFRLEFVPPVLTVRDAGKFSGQYYCALSVDGSNKVTRYKQQVIWVRHSKPGVISDPPGYIFKAFATDDLANVKGFAAATRRGCFGLGGGGSGGTTVSTGTNNHLGEDNTLRLDPTDGKFPLQHDGLKWMICCGESLKKKCAELGEGPCEGGCKHCKKGHSGLDYTLEDLSSKFDRIEAPVSQRAPVLPSRKSAKGICAYVGGVHEEGGVLFR